MNEFLYQKMLFHILNVRIQIYHIYELKVISFAQHTFAIRITSGFIYFIPVMIYRCYYFQSCLNLFVLPFNFNSNLFMMNSHISGVVSLMPQQWCRPFCIYRTRSVFHIKICVLCSVLVFSKSVFWWCPESVFWSFSCIQFQISIAFIDNKLNQNGIWVSNEGVFYYHWL